MHHCFTRAEFTILERLRARFLTADPVAGDYWRSDEELALYDTTFGERIGWKWDAVLGELIRRGWSPRSRRLLDWGCGSGIAGRRVLEAWPGTFTALGLHDRSSLALRFAARRAAEAFPELEIAPAAAPAPGTLLLISHVLNELTPRDLQALRPLLAQAEEIIWVEAGTHAESRRLVEEVREPMRAAGFAPVAPCTHGAACGLRVPENERHWCHTFGRPPSAAFQDARWHDFATTLGIDLRSLPYSFLVLAKEATPGPAGAARVLGHPREYKGYAKVLNCDAAGVEELMLQKRDAPALLRQVFKEPSPPIYQWERADQRISGGGHFTPASE